MEFIESIKKLNYVSYWNIAPINFFQLTMKFGFLDRVILL